MEARFQGVIVYPSLLDEEIPGGGVYPSIMDEEVPGGGV